MEKNEQVYSQPELEKRIAYYAEIVTPERFSRMRQVLEQRTRYITVILENLYQPHNASAVLRSCDAFGIQDVHIIENRNQFTANPTVDMGTQQWLSLHRYRYNSKSRSAHPTNIDGSRNQEGNIQSAYAENSVRAIESVRSAGYRIIATSPHANDVELGDLDLDRGKVALLFGTELEGLTPAALDAADEYVRIPMYGFVESFNISVSCALSLFHLSSLMRSSGLDWKLGDTEKAILLHEWLRKSIKRPDLHEKALSASFGQKNQ